MTPEKMADLHHESGPDQRPWTAQEYARALADPNCVVVTQTTGFAIGTVVMEQAELHMIIVDQNARRSGVGRSLLDQFQQICISKGAESIVLEVSTENTVAKSFYLARGFHHVGTRKKYYKTQNGAFTDALVLSKSLKSNENPS